MGSNITEETLGEWVVHDAQYRAVYLSIKRNLRGVEAVVFHGELGAGKTTFIKGFCAIGFGVEGMSSPTYSIVNLHPCTSQMGIEEIAHMDLYRLKTVDEFVALGGEEYIEEASVLALIEWPNLAIPFLSVYLEVHIDVLREGARKIVLSLKKYGV